MRKILFVSSAPLSLETFDGKEKRALSILKSLSKKNKIDIACIDQDLKISKKKISFCNEENRFAINFLSRLINTFFSLLKIKPLQNGYFYSKEMANFVQDNKDNYDTIIFHLIRCSQYLPSEFRGKTILEMTDLLSVSYGQIIKRLSIINPLKYLYILEKFLIRKYEREISNQFDRVVFISRKELLEAGKFIDKKKISVVENLFKVEKNVYKFRKNNNKVIFLGDINYLPNKLACREFSKNVIPRLNEKYPDIIFHIVGKINVLDKFYFKLYKNIKVHGPITNLKSIFKNTICGICNVKIATGLQNKILTYMSYGIPTIASKESFSNDLFKKNKDICIYSNDDEIIKIISQLKENKKFSNKLSKNSLITVKNKFGYSKLYLKYQKII